jgi:hypothetical protein
LVPPSVTVEPRVRGSAGSMVGILPYLEAENELKRLFPRKLLVNLRLIVAGNQQSTS